MNELPPLLVNGFLAGHQEILYELASETRGWADELGITLRLVARRLADEGASGAE